MTALVDTSFLFALANRNDKSHPACAAVAQSLDFRPVVPLTILPEVAYLLDVRLGHHIMQQFVEQIIDPAWILEFPRRDDLQRAAVLLAKYHDNRLDFVDATIIAIAERLKIKRVLTLDQRHFRVIQPQHCAAFELLP